MTAPRRSCVVFDLGGVVFASPVTRLAHAEARAGLPRHVLNRYIMHCRAWAELERGGDPDAFPDAYAAELRAAIAAGAASADLLRVSGASILATILAGDGRPRRPYVEALVELRRRGYKTAALTNNFKRRGEALASGLAVPAGISHADSGSTGESGEGACLASPAAELGNLFDVIVESAAVGLRKPDPRIYDILCERVGVPPREIVFLDDIGANLKPARAKGWTTIRVLGTDTDGVAALEKLEQVLGSGPLFRTGRQLDVPSSSKL